MCSAATFPLQGEADWRAGIKTGEASKRFSLKNGVFSHVLVFLNNLWGLGPSRNRVVVPARQATQPGGIGSLQAVLGLLKILKIRAQSRVTSKI